MFKNHKESIERLTNKLKKDEEILGLIIGGSIAHGYATKESDVDVLLVISKENYDKRLLTGETHYCETESCTYENGYVDGKFITYDFIKKVAQYGSEPAKFAFKDAFVVFSKIKDLQNIVDKASQYPTNLKQNKLERFNSQFIGWNWFYEEGLKKNNKYLIDRAVSNIVLFACRMILVYNEKLYPYHKWMLRETQQCEQKPQDIMQLIEKVLYHKNKDDVKKLYDVITLYFKDVIKEKDWCHNFVLDSELNWINGNTPISDI